MILNAEANPLALARAVLEAGVRIVQYRAKSGVVPEDARALRALTREHDSLFLINDDWQAAAQFEADGVHLGPDDTDFAQLDTLRRRLSVRIVGLSCGTVEEAAAAAKAGADYIGVGPVFASRSKLDAGEPLDIDGLRRIAAASPVPVAAIGGIGAANLSRVRQSGVAMAAVISAIADAPEPRVAAAELVRIWNAPE